MVELKNQLTAYMLLSSFFVAIGSYLLRVYSLVPVTLTYATIGSVILVLITSIFVHKGSRMAMNFGVILSVAAIISSLSSPAHLRAMTEILNGTIISVLDVLEILGFYLFPILYIFERFRRKIVSRNSD